MIGLDVTVRLIPKEDFYTRCLVEIIDMLNRRRSLFSAATTRERRCYMRVGTIPVYIGLGILPNRELRSNIDQLNRTPPKWATLLATNPVSFYLRVSSWTK